MLTRKQLELFNFINTEVKSSGVAPSFDEMKEALKLKSKSGIHRLISGLEERGFIKKLSHRARAIEILKYPPVVKTSNKKSEINSEYLEIENSKTKLYENPNLVRQVPLMGRIAAGSPIEAINDFSQSLDVPQSLLGNGTHYALEVKGDSMINAGIRNEDTILVREQKYANNGEIVVALISEEEATLKRFVKKGNKIHLQAENEEFEDQVYSADQVQIQGKLIGLIRSY